MFLTALRPNGPYGIGWGDPPVPMTTGFAGMVGGQRIKLFLPDYEVDGFFQDPGRRGHVFR